MLRGGYSGDVYDGISLDPMLSSSDSDPSSSDGDGDGDGGGGDGGGGDDDVSEGNVRKSNGPDTDYMEYSEQEPPLKLQVDTGIDADTDADAKADIVSATSTTLMDNNSKGKKDPSPQDSVMSSKKSRKSSTSRSNAVEENGKSNARPASCSPKFPSYVSKTLNKLRRPLDSLCKVKPFDTKSQEDLGGEKQSKTASSRREDDKDFFQLPSSSTITSAGSLTDSNSTNGIGINKFVDEGVEMSISMGKGGGPGTDTRTGDQSVIMPAAKHGQGGSRFVNVTACATEVSKARTGHVYSFYK